jgi:hypothetical protein
MKAPLQIETSPELPNKGAGARGNCLDSSLLIGGVPLAFHSNRFVEARVELLIVIFALSGAYRITL